MSYELRITEIERRRNRQRMDENLRRRQRETGHADQQAEQSVPVPSLADIANHEALIQTWRRLCREGGQAPGPDGVRFEDVDRRAAASRIRELTSRIADGAYEVGPALRVRQRKSGGHGYRTLTIRSVFDRTVAARIHEVVAPLWEAIFLPCSYGFRKRRGPQHMHLAIERAIVEHGLFVVATDDIRDAFDHVPIELIMQQHRERIEDPQLLALIERILRGYQHKSREAGIDQGCAYSPTAFNIAMHETLDVPMGVDRVPSYLRYADNLAILTQDVPEGHHALQLARERLSTVGLALKGEDGGPKDLRDGSSASILGLELSYHDGQITWQLGEKAWFRLRMLLGDCHKTASPSKTARDAVRGWIRAHGAAFRECWSSSANRIRITATQQGFRELRPRDLEGWLQGSWDAWVHFRSSRSNQGEDGAASGTATPAAGSDPQRPVTGPADEAGPAADFSECDDGDDCPF